MTDASDLFAKTLECVSLQIGWRRVRPNEKHVGVVGPDFWKSARLSVCWERELVVYRHVASDDGTFVEVLANFERRRIKGLKPFQSGMLFFPRCFGISVSGRGLGLVESGDERHKHPPGMGRPLGFFATADTRCRRVAGEIMNAKGEHGSLLSFGSPDRSEFLTAVEECYELGRRRKLEWLFAPLKPERFGSSDCVA